ncbi:MAG TPA: hypothetical protein PJ991_09600 [Kiritimatiellia bacterium]|nr:hypothetical protein [Kiritimatiellia bacterium]
MYQYRIFAKASHALQKIAFLLLLALGFLVAVETLRLFALLYRYNPVAAYGFAGVAGLFVLYFTLQFILSRRNRLILRARGYSISNRSSHARLKKHLLHQIRCAKQLSTHRLITDAQASAIRQKTNDIQDILHHHPLIDDLYRAIDNMNTQVLNPAYSYLDGIAERITRAKIKASIQDLYQPPFPVIPPLVVMYHQITLVSELTDTYLSRPSLRDYGRVMIDVWKIMTKGDYMRYGQRIFSGINSNPYSLARTGEDVGHALSITWLSHAVAAATRQRCTTRHDWDLDKAIDQMQDQVIPCLEKTHATLQPDVIPKLKSRIRHYAPYGQDPDQFAEQINQSLIKAVDAVVISLVGANRQSAARSSSISRHGIGEDNFAPAETPPLPEQTNESATTDNSLSHRRIRRRRREKSSMRGFFHRLLNPRPRIGQ